MQYEPPRPVKKFPDRHDRSDYKLIVYKSGWLWTWNAKSVQGAVVSGLSGTALTEKRAIKKGHKKVTEYIEKNRKIKKSTREIKIW